ncbi:hypothetical protein [Erythrobacter sp. HL-111]|uniref:hypothetical protein n=1 Tax=Erythrobacter sp. HL-111 TaxID=1798193 RepID=UPI0006DBA773|nr:hypothetical protein [Erythrobacter sp. HL-111]KPP92887.1 MAG: hypothetical protein HLUCCO15_07000 [Erythrobacteraceae bacterium HL-111]SDT00290.1 hypothetical protein SAMN04515621_2694 [Erythrobacter sp. HL-111]
MPLPSSTSDWSFDPKWLVIGFALGALVMVLSFDLRLGGAVAAGFALIGAFYLWLRLRFAPPPGEPASERDAMIQRFARLREQRQLAASRENASSAQARPRSGEEA